jgi:hypothetical protein
MNATYQHCRRETETCAREERQRERERSVVYINIPMIAFSLFSTTGRKHSTVLSYGALETWEKGGPYQKYTALDNYE